MIEREKLIAHLKSLIETNRVKQLRLQEKYKTSPKVGYLTRETCEMVALLPQIRRLGVMFEFLAGIFVSGLLIIVGVLDNSYEIYEPYE
jgi:hypothetical protein